MKTLQHIPDFLVALENEIRLRQSYLSYEEIESLYFGGGTPSLLTTGQINRIYKTIVAHHRLAPGCEITLEANPDDLTRTYVMQLKKLTPVNRLSIGIQSFSGDDLKLLNRRHNASQSFSCMEDAARAGFSNISIDLIYGLPGMTVPSWEQNLKYAFDDVIQHISAYHLTLETGTVLHREAEKKSLMMPSEEESHSQYMKLCDMAKKHGYHHYEISNLCRNGYQAIHNTGYWKQKKYLGLGPSAHSYDLVARQWNISDAGRYIRAMRALEPEYSQEFMDEKKRLNEYIMLSLRMQTGLSLEHIRQEFGDSAAGRFQAEASCFTESGHLVHAGSRYILTEEAWFISDHIISRLLTA